ncbi:MAG TPA: N-formylglutamate amidohydrolase [Rhizomicrobium sp.]|jgi:predicted N-formylglutamate amidohydrolase
MDETPFERVDGRGVLIFLCDHASRALPQAFGTLGLDQGDFATHIASDIGAAEVTRTLASAYGAPAILARWSRLLVDLNRGEDDPTLVMKLSDGRIVPGNRNADFADRIVRFHAPYHAAIAGEIARAGGAPILFSMHSFTPVWKGFQRPWEAGVLWDRDDRLAKPLLAALAKAGFVTGDNEPYDGELENDCLYRHGTMNGLPHVLIEIRQDLIATPEAARAFAARLKPILDEALAAMGARDPLYTTFEGTYAHGRNDAHGIGGRRLPPAGRAFARAQRRAEHRPDESCGLLPQLLGRLVSRGGGRKGHRAGERRCTRGGLRHGARGMEKALPERGHAGAESRVRQGPKDPQLGRFGGLRGARLTPMCHGPRMRATQLIWRCSYPVRVCTTVASVAWVARIRGP